MIKVPFRRRVWQVSSRPSSPPLAPAAGIIASLSGGLWLFRKHLWAMLETHPSAGPGIMLAALVLVGFLLLWIALEDWLRRSSWRKRFFQVVETPTLSSREAIQSEPPGRLDAVEQALKPVFRVPWVDQLSSDWKAAEFGNHGMPFLILLLALSLAGWLAGCRIGGLILGGASACLFPFLLASFVRAQAARKQQRFPEQLPQALDGLASGLSAGLSFHQAMAYTADRMPAPASATFTWIKLRLDLGHSVEETLSEMQMVEQDESFGLLIEGILLQRQFGGDLIQMLQETANLIRQRNELEREARSVTAQGRLSGIVIAALVPISAGILLLFNPQYIDVLFNSTLGQVFIVAALALLLIGWGIISRLIRIRY